MLVGHCEDAEEVVAALGDRAGRSPTTPRRWAVVPPNLVHDTLLAAYLLDPARRGFPLLDIAEERGLATGDRGSRPAPTRC